MTKLPWDDIRQLVYDRGNGCCEYCQSCDVNTGQTMQVDHIDPFDGDELENLALSCWNCNNHKRQATHAIDPDTAQQVKLFHPRNDAWIVHFKWVDNHIRIEGQTPVGRATTFRLKMNRPIILHARKRWVDAGYHPPKLS